MCRSSILSSFNILNVCTLLFNFWMMEMGLATLFSYLGTFYDVPILDDYHKSVYLVFII